MGNNSSSKFEKLSGDQRALAEGTAVTSNYEPGKETTKITSGLIRFSAVMMYIRLAAYAILLGVYVTEFTSAELIGFHAPPVLLLSLFVILIPTELIDSIVCMVKNRSLWWFEFILMLTRIAALSTLLAAYSSIHHNQTAETYWGTNAEHFRKITTLCGFTVTASIYAIKTVNTMVPISFHDKQPDDKTRSGILITWSSFILIDTLTVATLFAFDIVNVSTIGNEFTVSVLVFLILNCLRAALLIGQLILALIYEGYVQLIASAFITLVGVAGFITAYSMFQHSSTSDVFMTNPYLARTILEWTAFSWNGLGFINGITRLIYWGTSLRDSNKGAYTKINS